MATRLASALVGLGIAFTLHGCGGGGKTTTTMTTTSASSSTSTITTSTSTSTSVCDWPPEAKQLIPITPVGPLPPCNEGLRQTLVDVATKWAKTYNLSVGVGFAGRTKDGHRCTADAVALWPPPNATDVANPGVDHPSSFEGFMLGSFTKIWTASAVMKLAEDGKIHLDKPACMYFEQAFQRESNKSLDELFGVGIRQVTTRELLSMRGSIADYDELQQQLQHPCKDFGAGYTVELFGRSTGPAPGMCGTYSSMSYVLLGLLLVQQSGASAWDTYDQNVWKKHFPDVRFSLHGPCSRYTKVVGKCKLCNDRGTPVSAFSCGSGYSSGNLIARPGDSALFLWKLFNAELVKAKTLKQMIAYKPLGATGAKHGMQCTSWCEGCLYGLGVEAPANGVAVPPDHDGTDFPGHSGVTYGFQSVNAYDRKNDFAVTAAIANDVIGANAIFADVHGAMASIGAGSMDF